MKRESLIAILLTGMSAAAFATPQQASPDATAPPAGIAANSLAAQADAAAIQACIGKTDALLAALDKGDYAGAEMDFNPTMQAGLPPAQLKQSWEALPARFGKPGPRGAPHNSLSGTYVVITVPMPYPGMMLAAQVACAADGKIAGFHVMTLPAPESSASSAMPAAASTSARR